MLSYMTDQSKASAKKKKTHIHIQTLTALDCMATLHCLNDKLMQGDYQFPNWHITFLFILLTFLLSFLKSVVSFVFSISSSKMYFPLSLLICKKTRSLAVTAQPIWFRSGPTACLSTGASVDLYEGWCWCWSTPCISLYLTLGFLIRSLILEAVGE